MKKHNLKEVVAVVNNKGGVGKTTTVQSIAFALTRRNKDDRVLVIDLDAQCNLTKLLQHNNDNNGRTSYDVFKDYQPDTESGNLPVYKSDTGLYYVPASPLLQEADIVLSRQLQPTQVLAECFGLPVDDHTDDHLTYVNDSFEYILIDCPPALSRTTLNAMAVADSLIIPSTMEGLSISGLGSIMVQMRRVQKGINPQLKLKAIVPVMVDLRGNITKQFLEELPEAFDAPVSKTIIHRCLKVNEAQSRLTDIFSYAPKCKAAQDYEALTDELFKARKKAIKQ